MDDLRARRISLSDYLGNQYADSLARRGADLWQYPWDMVQSISSTRGRAWRIGLRLAAVTLSTAQVYNSSNTFKPVSQPLRRLSLSELYAKLNEVGHLMFHVNRRIHCGHCSLAGSYSRQQVSKMLARGPCQAISLTSRAPFGSISQPFGAAPGGEVRQFFSSGAYCQTHALTSPRMKQIRLASEI